MKKFKKILALALSLAMVLGMSATAFASNTNPKDLNGPKPSAEDDGKITIEGLKTGDVVNIYKIVKANYNAEGFTGYESVHKTGTGESATPMIADVEAPTVAEINALLTHIEAATPDHSGCVSGDATATVGPVTAGTDGKAEFDNLKVGTYLVDVEPADGNTVTYGPMVASVYYVTDNGADKLQQGTVDAGDYWTIKGTIAHAKSSDNSDIKKSIIGSTATANGKGDDVAEGSTVTFAIEGLIPAYDPAYWTADKNPTYVITDTLSEGLDLTVVEDDGSGNGKAAQQVLQEAADLVFGKTGDISNATVEIDSSNERKFTIKLTSAYLKSLAAMPANNATPDNAATSDRTFKFVYTAVLNGDAVNFDPSTNTAKVEYSNNPDNTSSKKTGEDQKTYHYTFAIGANLSATTSITNSTVTTDIIKKIDADGNVTDEQQTITPGDTTTMTGVTPLSGAVFELRKSDGTVAGSGTTDGEGRLTISGLDAGDYTLVETKAPEGYSLEGTVSYPVKIEASYNEDGTLDTVEISINGAKNIYKGGYKDGALESIKISSELTKDGVTNKVDNKTVITYIKNTTLAALPSTGGIGTTIFTIGGCAIMILAAALYFATRRKSAR